MPADSESSSFKSVKVSYNSVNNGPVFKSYILECLELLAVYENKNYLYAEKKSGNKIGSNVAQIASTKKLISPALMTEILVVSDNTGNI